jgi:hypothetical protein
MNTLAKQRGVTAIGWLVILGLIAFFVFIGLKLFPIYAENFSVVSSIKSLKSESQITQKTSAQILTLIDRRFQINDVENATRKNITITKKGGVLTVSCQYSVRTKLFGPLSLIADFNESVEVIAN